MEDMRIRSDRAFNSLVYIGAGMVLNHLVSAIHAGRKATVLEQQRLSLGDSRSLDLRWTPKISRRTVGLKLTCRF